MLFNLRYILDDIKKHLDKNIPFSIVRVGDGDLKLLDELVRGRVNKQKFKRSGIPFKRIGWVLNLYKEACNSADYTSSFEMYYTDKFWGRKFSRGTKMKVQAWKELYEKVGIINQNFCNPEVGYLMFLNEPNNLLDLIKGKKVCLITCFPKAARILKKNGVSKAKVIRIPPINRGHFDEYSRITDQIKSSIEEFDLFLVGAGALGKGYSTTIKNNGGISIDIGQVMNTWAGRPIAGRFKHVLETGKRNGSFELKPNVQRFREFL